MKRSEALAYRSAIESAASFFSDREALNSKWMFPTFSDLIGITVEEGTRFRYNGDLYKMRQTAVIQEIYPPSIDTASLYVRVSEDDQGSIDNPIPFELNMELIENKYYTQNGVLYRCRESLNACYWNLSDVTGRYVEVV